MIEFSVIIDFMSVYSNRFLTGFATLSKISDKFSLKTSFFLIGWHVITVIYLVPFITMLICLTLVTASGPSRGLVPPEGNPEVEHFLQIPIFAFEFLQIDLTRKYSLQLINQSCF